MTVCNETVKHIPLSRNTARPTQEVALSTSLPTRLGRFASEAYRSSQNQAYQHQLMVAS